MHVIGYDQVRQSDDKSSVRLIRRIRWIRIQVWRHRTRGGASRRCSPDEVRGVAVGPHDRANGVLLLLLLVTHQHRVSMMTRGTSVWGTAPAEAHAEIVLAPTPAETTTPASMEITAPAAKNATCRAVFAIVRGPFESASAIAC
jgi:hypothetical protein